MVGETGGSRTKRRKKAAVRHVMLLGSYEKVTGRLFVEKPTS